MEKIISQLENIVGPDGISLDDVELKEFSRDTWVLSDLHDYLGTGPDSPLAIISPANTDQLSKVVSLCSSKAIPMIPYGAGSGVCGSIVGQRDAVVISTRNMQGLIELDEENLLVTFWAGTMGGEAERLVAEKGYTIGHWPQSIEISSVGGWLATRASGQYSTAYGNIEDIVFSFEAVLPDGSVYTSAKTPRAAAGPDLRQLFIGSEGTLGIFAKVTFSIRAQAAKKQTQAFYFEKFPLALQCVREVMTRGFRPPVVRLYDGRESNRHFKDACPKGQMMLIFLHEGEPEVAQAEASGVASVCKSFAASVADQNAVEQWFQRRNEVPSFRSLIEQGLIVDTIEVGAVWSRLHEVYERVMSDVAKVESVIAVSAHLSHAYKSGANLYFTIAAAPDSPEQMEAIYLKFWDAAMCATLESGGGIAHHHGIGRVRKNYLEQELGAGGLSILKSIKASLDPMGLMNPGNLLP
jgi:alkyldihydroxyacetonephosphate synthase